MFINEIGTNYASENLYGAHFVYEGKVYRLEEIDGRSTGNIQAREIDSYEIERLPMSVITGWRTFKYPRLGYRRFNDEMVGSVERQARSYTRGLCYDNLIVKMSDVTLAEHFYRDIDRVYEWRDENFSTVIKQTLLPEYDGKPEWAKLISGESKAFVPSYNTIVERAGSDLSVRVSGFYVGKIVGDKIIASGKNIPIIKNIVRKYAS